MHDATKKIIPSFSSGKHIICNMLIDMILRTSKFQSNNVSTVVLCSILFGQSAQFDFFNMSIRSILF